MEALFISAQFLKTGNHRRLTEQEHMRTAFRRARSQRQQGLQRRLIELLGIIDQQVDFLPGQCQLHHLRQDGAYICTGNVQGLRHLLQDAGSIAGPARRNHDTLHRLLVGARHQCLAQQGLAAALRPGDHQQQLAVTGKVMQLPQHRLALRRKKLEARNPWGKGVVVELEVTEERLVGMQTSHRDLINL